MTNHYNVIEILEKAQLIHSDGTKDFFETIHITDSSIHVGKIEIKRKKNLLNMIIYSTPTIDNSYFNSYEEFIENSKISKDNVIDIVDGIKRHVLQKVP